MRKIFLIVFIQAVLMQWSFAQNNVTAKFIIPDKPVISLLKPVESTGTRKVTVNTFSISEPENLFLSVLNSQPVLRLQKAAKNPITVITEISFNDLLENSVNRLNTNLLYTYDGHIDELFKEAPSLFKLTCIMPF